MLQRLPPVTSRFPHAKQRSVVRLQSPRGSILNENRPERETGTTAPSASAESQRNGLLLRSALTRGTGLGSVLSISRQCLGQVR